VKFRCSKIWAGAIQWGGAMNVQRTPQSSSPTRVTTNLPSSFEPARELERVRKAGVNVITWHDADYPPLLREIDDLPPILYVRGAFTPADPEGVTIVGTRRPTAYGREVAKHLAGELASAGATIVSGLARGIDGTAHRACLDAGGRTIAVLGSGVDVPYPPEHAKLMDEIAENGAVVSEYALGTKPEARHFPRRNRLLSGLSVATLVIEAGVGSGTLSTVRFALEQNREVLCVPGSIYSPSSRLTNQLIQEGAKLVMDVQDVLDEIRTQGTPDGQPQLPGLIAADSSEEMTVYAALAYEPQHVDEVSRATGLPVTQVTGALAVMELKGRVLQVGRLNYIRAREPKAPYATSDE
ncbi:MAG: DNA-processing protein DprA, partial [Chloroflexi bacterium]|nr:DNA-processing protein DprA [Chloroflexota bacterium]